ncbi:MAG: hypothetical protein ACOX1O_00705 [Eggerthellaceae bacterium]
MAKLILHIGTHKTGTTALQSFFGENRQLLAQRGIAYPILKTKYHEVTHERNAHWLMNQAKHELGILELTDTDHRAIDEGRKLLAEAAASADVVVLSDEQLWAEGAAHKMFWRRLVPLLDEFSFDRIQAVVYFRRQDEFVSSMWKQWVKAAPKETRSIEDFGNKAGIKSSMNYDRGVVRLERVFDHDDIIIRLYGKKNYAGANIYEDFFAACGLDFPEGATLSRGVFNPSTSNDATVVKSIINQVYANHPALEQDNLFYQPAINASSAEEHPDKRPLLSLDKSQEILARYRDGNARIAREYFGREDGVLFDEPTAAVDAYESGFSQSETDAIRILADALLSVHEQNLNLKQQVAACNGRIVRLERSLPNRIWHKIRHQK